MNLLKTLATVSGMTLISRITGLIRDVLISRAFGAGMYTDAFFVAFKLPNLLRRLFAEGAFSQAFVPVLGEVKNKQGEEATRQLVDHVSAFLALALFVVTLIGVLAAPAIVYVTAPGFVASPQKFDITVTLLRIIFPYILFISLVSFAGGILNTYARFTVPAFTPVLLNLSFILCALFLAPYCTPPILAMAWAVFIGGILQLAFQVPFLLKLKMLPRFRLNLKDTEVWRIVKLMGPAVFGVSIGQISLVLNIIFASFLVSGSVSWLYYADRLMEFPTGLLGAALGTILLPYLSQQHASNNVEEYSRLLDWGLRLSVMLAAPAALALAILAIPMVSTLFFYGKFTLNDLMMTREALMAYSVGLLGLILVKVLAPGFYAMQNIKTPVKIALFTLVATQLMNLAFVIPLRHAGLALAIGLGACLNAALLYRGLRRHGIYHPQAGWALFLLKVSIALIVMGALLWWAMGSEYLWTAIGLLERVVRLTCLVLGGAVVYFATLFVLGFRPRDFSKRTIG